MRYKDIYCNIVYYYQKNGKPTKCPVIEGKFKKHYGVIKKTKNKKNCGVIEYYDAIRMT